ncbi:MULTISPECIES: DNA topoisomerase IB [Bordetella]|uniref:DNA topoisomerase n=2 Tax=Bordetella TaxID=517 RepID=A0A261VRB6_9BORD|nr:MULTISPECIES: DNA topoisomerase IB [Bordetella]MDM9557668.1 DNA topoisomerase IB [Bordetella petrii]OZI75783.1 DNA topoisomerase [Bordetella genomosp. 2]
MSTASQQPDAQQPPYPAPSDAGLVYVDDRRPGYSRRRGRTGKFHYFDTRGRRIVDRDVIRRIDALAIPPAYTDVWICPRANGHLQATGRDARGRKQYRYHPDWTALRDAGKYDQLAEFAACLPRIRKQVERDMARPALSQEKVLAVLVRLLEITLIRIGTREYARANGSYGLTTLKRRHTAVAGDKLRLRFTGKSGVAHDVTVTDARIARTVKRCLDLPGQELFHYRDADGEPRAIRSELVNAYLKQAGGGAFTAKHYRTWAGSVMAFALLQRQPAASETEARRVIVEVVKQVARRLSNTPAVCRRCYIHPAILAAYQEARLPPRGAAPAGPRGLNADERRLWHFLRAG